MSHSTLVYAVALLSLTLAGCAGSVEAPPSPGPRLRVLGTAQDGGFPHAACRCARCESARREPRRARAVASLALLGADGGTYLVDATPDVRLQLDRLADRSDVRGRVDRAPVDGVFLTHAHLGHYTGLGFFGFEAIHTRELPLYVTPAMAEFLTSNAPWSQLVSLRNVVAHTLEPGTPLRVDSGVEVTAYRVPHRDEFADTVGFLFAGPTRRVFYVPDTDGWDRWSTPLEAWLRNHDVDTLIADGTFFSGDELPGREVSEIGHPLVVDTMERLGRAVAAGELRVWFTHFNHSNAVLDDDDRARREVASRGFGILEDGDEIEL